jgi:hypothetical protein
VGCIGGNNHNTGGYTGYGITPTAADVWAAYSKVVKTALWPFVSVVDMFQRAYVQASADTQLSHVAPNSDDFMGLPEGGFALLRDVAVNWTLAALFYAGGAAPNGFKLFAEPTALFNSIEAELKAAMPNGCAVVTAFGTTIVKPWTRPYIEITMNVIKKAVTADQQAFNAVIADIGRRAEIVKAAAPPSTRIRDLNIAGTMRFPALSVASAPDNWQKSAALHRRILKAHAHIEFGVPTHTLNAHPALSADGTLSSDGAALASGDVPPNLFAFLSGN